MAKTEKITELYESFPKIAKLVIQFFLGAIVGGVYRIFRYLETKNTITLAVGIIALIPGPDVVAWVIDFITELLHNRIDVFAD